MVSFILWCWISDFIRWSLSCTQRNNICKAKRPQRSSRPHVNGTIGDTSDGETSHERCQKRQGETTLCLAFEYGIKTVPFPLQALKRVLDARQLGLKYIANVTYGYTSATYSGRMPAVEIADSIVQSGRETLEKVG